MYIKDEEENVVDLTQIKNVSRSRRRKTKMWQCKKCNLIFSKSTLWRNHRKTHVPLEKPHLKEPSYSFDGLQNLYVCDVCSAEFTPKDEIEIHLKCHLNHFTCDTCESTFKSAVAYCLHTITHTENDNLHCPLCLFTTTSLQNCKSHFIQKHSQYRCNPCDKGFSDGSALSKHKSNYHSESKFYCIVCGKILSSKSYLVAHQIKIHQVSSTGALIGGTCDQCHQYFSKTENLERHKMNCLASDRKTNPKNHLCSICGRGFRHNYKLRDHVLTHTGEQPFTCTVCGKSFSRKDRLQQHSRIHTGEQPYTCEFMDCGKKFRNLNQFKVHKLVHFSTKPYVCSLCSKSYYTGQGLRKHLATCV